jgi:hypothetical protein
MQYSPLLWGAVGTAWITLHDFTEWHTLGARVRTVRTCNAPDLSGSKRHERYSGRLLRTANLGNLL